MQLAKALGVSQQTLQSYVVGRRRLSVSALPPWPGRYRCRSIMRTFVQVRALAAPHGDLAKRLTDSATILFAVTNAETALAVGQVIPFA